MKHRVISSLFPALIAVLLLSGVSNAQASDLHFSIGNGNHGYRYHDYRTSDNTYNSWYGNSGTSYGYSTYYPNSYYSTPYIYSTPSVQFGTWYGDGYRNHSRSYGSGRGYYGGRNNSRKHRGR